LPPGSGFPERAPMLKKVFLYFVLFLFLLNTTGYFLVFEVQKYHVKKTMQSLVKKPGNSIVILELNDSEGKREFQRTDRSEIRHNGSMYDVILEIPKGETTVFYCIHDSREENLLAMMKIMNNKKMMQLIWEQVVKIAFPRVLTEPVLLASSELEFQYLNESVFPVFLTREGPPPKTV
jgi:hypothetical protein